MLFYLCPWVYPDAGHTEAWELWRSGRIQFHPELFQSFQQHVSKGTWCLPTKKQHFSLICLLFYYLHSFIPMACAECDDSLPFSGAFSIPLCYIPFPTTLFHQLVFHPTSSCHLFLGLPLSLDVSKFTYNKLFEIQLSSNLCTCPTSIIYLTLLSLLYCLHLYFNIHLGLKQAARYKAHQPSFRPYYLILQWVTEAVYWQPHTKSNTHCTSWAINYQ